MIWQVINIMKIEINDFDFHGILWHGGFSYRGEKAFQNVKLPALKGGAFGAPAVQHSWQALNRNEELLPFHFCDRLGQRLAVSIHGILHRII